MQALDQFGAYHGMLIGLGVLLAGAGLPLPMMPMLLAAGALAHIGKVDPVAAVLLLPVCLSLGDILWFFLGRRFGHKILGLVCRISLERDVCIRKTQDTFAKRGLPVLLFSRFVPGLGSLAPSLAGATGKPFARFLPFEFAGTFIYTSLYIAPGYLFADQLDAVVQIISGAGIRLSVAFLILFAAYVGFKLAARHWLIRKATALALPPEEVHKKLVAHPTLLIVDLRGPNDLAADPYCIPGAKFWREKQVMEALAALPRDTPVVLFCACPNQATSTRVALALRRKGFRNVWPLRDGLAGWRAAGLPLEPTAAVASGVTTPMTGVGRLTISNDP